ncbi:MAG: 30S ribosomal protein S12 methylthiotransferase RimO, partial [Bacteroidales bacterium]
FTYSEEEGTYGALNFKDNISRLVKQERYDTLMEVQAAISISYNNSRIGSVEKVLVDSFSKDMSGNSVLVARSQKESPEVDGEILIGGDSLIGMFVPQNLIGNFVNVKIIGANEYDLLAELI